MEIELIPIADLLPYANNARTHSTEQVEQIAASIREFGWTNPVLIDQHNGIIAGHGRALAAEKVGMTEVPCIRLGHLTETQRRAYVIADNQLALNAGWDEQMLGLELSMLREEDFDLGVLGFDAEAIENALNPDEPEIKEDEVPEPPVDPITKPGDLWLLGDHRLLCGDSTKAEDVERLMAGAKADLVFTDPPYNCADEMSESFYANGNSPAMKGLAAASWDKGFDVSAFLSTLTLHCPKDGSVYVCTSHMLAPEIWQWMKQQKSSHHSYIVWCKPNPMPSLAKRHPTWATELICYATFGKHTFNFPTTGHALSWWEISKNSANKDHPTQKPVEVPAKAISLSSNTGNLVLDPFLGSGTTLIAAEQLGRKCYGMEISPAYCDVIVNRWETLTGKKAVKESADQPTDQP